MLFRFVFVIWDNYRNEGFGCFLLSISSIEYGNIKYWILVIKSNRGLVLNVCFNVYFVVLYLINWFVWIIVVNFFLCGILIF